MMRVLKRGKLFQADPEAVAASPASVPEEEPEETAPSVWDDLLIDDEDDNPDVVAEETATEMEPEPSEREEPETPPEAVDEAAAPVEEAPPSETPEPEAAQRAEGSFPETAEVPEQPQVAPAEEPASVAPETPQPLSEEEQRAQALQMFSNLQTAYQLSEDDASALSVEPEKVMPRLLAGVHMSIQGQVMQQLQTLVPQMVGAVIQQQRTREADEGAFFEAWPTLRGHRQEVEKFAPMWRQMNPQASRDEAIAGIGKHMMIALGYPLQESPSSAPGRDVPPPPPPPAKPAAVPPRSSAPAQPQNQFTQLAEEFLDDEDL